MTGNIYISGQIGTFDGATGVTLADVIAQVKKQPKASAFNVHINSEGGLVDVGFDIYNYLKSVGKPLTTIGSGIVASIATVIFMAGSKRQLRENTSFMVHLPWGSSMGTADELEQYADQLRAVEKQLIAFYKKSLNLNEQALLPLLRNETWLTPNQLTALGFTTSRLIPAAPKAYLKPKFNMKGNFSERDRHWMESLFNKVLGKLGHGGMMNKIVQDATGIEIDFTDLPDDAVPEIGAEATIDGEPAQGEYVMPEGQTYVFEAGVLSEIIEEDAAEEVAMLRNENKTLKRQLNGIKSEVLALKRQVGSKYSFDAKKASNRRPAENDRAAGLREYLRSKKAK
ncbi:MAG: head maturation protease, ClpP-related [Flavobacterium sp.]